MVIAGIPLDNFTTAAIMSCGADRCLEDRGGNLGI